MAEHEPGTPVDVEPGEIKVSETGDVIIGVPTAVAIIVTPDEEE